ncbi:MAG: thioredoxin family protein [candidate division WOR-3 bacterium]
MKKVYIFGRQNCPVCKDAYEKFCYFKEKKGFKASVKYFDIDTVEGMAEGAFYEISDIPTIIIFEDDQEIVRWSKKPPVSEEFLPYLIK